ncbi:hypothetical protein BGZ98_008204 [Dissophora globulifera]|nr:hypothetical protein BGZ98_008204 [Dissophora globulifera]
MESADARLRSFTQKTRSWPHPQDKYIATPEKLADAGFYWRPSNNSPDNVICFLCSKSLDGWADTDDPYDEHLSHSRLCGWAIIKTIPYYDNGDLPFHWDNMDELPKGERMTKARLDTFGKWWPHERTKGWFGTTKRMVNAGFFYSPTEESLDNVQCPYCYLALDGWEFTDDPVHEHQRREPMCPFFATRAAAPTKSSAAKASKTKRKNTVDIKDSSPNEQSLGSPRTQHVHAASVEKLGELKNHSTRLFKQPAASSVPKEYTAGDDPLSLPGNLASAEKRALRLGEEQMESSNPSVDIDVSRGVTLQLTKASKGKRVATTELISPGIDMQGTPRIKIEGSGAPTSRADSAGSGYNPIPLQQLSATSSRKRQNLDRADSITSTLSEPLSLPLESRSSSSATVITKKRKLKADTIAATEQFWESTVEDTDMDAVIDDNSDASGETELSAFHQTRSSSSAAGKLAPTQRRRKVVKTEAFVDEVSQQQQQEDLMDETPLHTMAKRRGGAKRQPRKTDAANDQPTAKPKRKVASVRATQQGTRAASISRSSNSRKKRVGKVLIEIFDPPADVTDAQDYAREREPGTDSTGVPNLNDAEEPEEVEAMSATEEVVEKPNGTLRIGDERSSSVESGPTLANRRRTTMSRETSIFAAETALAVVAPPTLADPPELPDTAPQDSAAAAPDSNSTLAAMDTQPFDVNSPSYDTEANAGDESMLPSPMTPMRRPVVSLFDIENADIIIIDPSTPIRRPASRKDLEGWEDEDRRESGQSGMTSPFISPSQWEHHGSFLMSTPKPKAMSLMPIPGHTPRARIKDMVGNAESLSATSLFKGSPGAKTISRTNTLISPEQKQQKLINRLEGLMQDNDSEEVMAVAEHALMEEVKLLRRSQNKERRLAASAAAATSAALQAPSDQKSSDALQDRDVMMMGMELSGNNGDAHDDNINNINPPRTPIRNPGTTASLLFDSTTPGTPAGSGMGNSRTPLPISKVISAIGAASRRNAPVSPFVRTPVKKSMNYLRLEDLEPNIRLPPLSSEQQSLEAQHGPEQRQQQHPQQEQQDRSTSHSSSNTTNRHPVDPFANDDDPFQEYPNVSHLKPDQTMNSRREANAGSRESVRDQEDLGESSDSSRLQSRREQMDRIETSGGIKTQQTKPKFDIIDGNGNDDKLHRDPEENERRLRLVQGSGVNTRELKMTVEEFHRHCANEQIKMFELQCEAWIQRFLEEAERVRNAILDDGGR